MEKNIKPNMTLIAWHQRKQHEKIDQQKTKLIKK